MIFAGMNAVWTSIDGEPRFGSALILESGVPEMLAEIPNPFAKDPTEYLLPDLPPAPGWQKREIADPWTVRPINLDGTIPTDAEVAEILESKHPDLRKMVEIGWNTDALKDRRAWARGAKRTASNYTDGTVAFNVVLERKREPIEVDPNAFGPLDLALYGQGKLLAKAFEMVTPKEEVAGLLFKHISGPQERTQQDTRGATLSLLLEDDDFEIRIWGNGTTEDAERLVMGLQAALLAARERDESQ